RPGARREPARRHEIRAAVRHVPRARGGGGRVGRSGSARLVSADAAAVMRRLAQAVWPLAVLTIFLATFRRGAPEAAADAGGAPCDPHGDSRTTGAVARLERCLALDPGDVESMIALGDAFETASRTDRAEALYRRALDVEPRDARLHVRLGRLLLARGDAAAARREGEAALQSHVGSREALDLLAEARAR